MLLLLLTLWKLPGGAMQLVASSPEPKYVTAPPRGGGAPTSSMLPSPHSQTPEQKFAPFPLTVSTTGGHEGHQQKGEIVSQKATFEANLLPMHLAKCRSSDNLFIFRGPHHTFDACWWLFCPPARISSSFYSDFDAYPPPPPLIEDLNLRPRLSDYWNE